MATFLFTQTALQLLLHHYPSNCLPNQKALCELIMTAKDSGSSFLIFSLFFYFCITAPIVEEAIFRLSLNKLQYLPLSIFCFVAFVSSEFLFRLQAENTLFLWLKTFWIVCIWLILMHLGRNLFYLKSLENFWEKPTKIAVIFSLCFALLHMNYGDIASPLNFALAIFPFLFLGIVLSFVRIKLGFAYSCTYHALNNAIAFVAVLLVNV